MGGMGYSFGAGIGMCFARGTAHGPSSSRATGRSSCTAWRLHTAIQYRLPITVVLFNNNAHAMCVTREQLFYGGQYSYNRFTPSRLGAGLAAMFPGLPSVDVADTAALPAALRDAFAHDGPVGGEHRMLGRRDPAVRTVSRNAVHNTDSIDEEMTDDVAARA